MVSRKMPIGEWWVASGEWSNRGAVAFTLGLVSAFAASDSTSPLALRAFNSFFQKG